MTSYDEEIEGICGETYDHKWRPGDLECRECHADLSAWNDDADEETQASAGTPMSREAMAEWLRLRGVDDATYREQLLAKYAGKTEDEMDEIYDSMHGSMA